MYLCMYIQVYIQKYQYLEDHLSWETDSSHCKLPSGFSPTWITV